MKPLAECADLDFKVAVIAQTGYKICGFPYDSPGKIVIFYKTFRPIPFLFLPHHEAQGYRGPRVARFLERHIGFHHGCATPFHVGRAETLNLVTLLCISIVVQIISGNGVQVTDEGQTRVLSRGHHHQIVAILVHRLT